MRWRRVLFGVAVLLLLGPPLQAPIHAGTSSPVEENVSNDSTARDTEPSIAVNPLNSQNLLIAWMKDVNSPYRGIIADLEKGDLQDAENGVESAAGETQPAVATSFDGGASWTIQTLPFTSLVNSTFADATALFAPDGTAYVSGIAYNHTYQLGADLVTRSTDGGLTWSAPVTVVDGSQAVGDPVDRPWLAAGPNGALYLVSHTIFTDEVGGTITGLTHEYLTRSTDGGVTWSAPRDLTNPQYPFSSDPAASLSVGAGGVVAFAYNAESVPEGQACSCAVVAISTDGGSTFAWHTVTALTGENYGVNVTDQGAGDVYRLAVGPTLAADPAVAGRFAVARIVYPGMVGYDLEHHGTIQLEVALTNDYGATWSGPAVIGQDPANLSSDHPWLAYGPDGELGAVWRSHTGHCCRDTFTVWSDVAPNGDLDFAPPVELSTAVSTTDTTGLGDDYLGAAVDTQNLHAAWADGRTGNEEIFYARVALPPDTTPPTTRITAAPALVSSPGPSFSFTGNDNRTPASRLTFQCSLDGSAFGACANPAVYSGLAYGRHTFTVRAVDAAGNADPRPPSWTWTVRAGP